MRSKEKCVLTTCAATNKRHNQGNGKTLEVNVSTNARLTYNKTLNNRAHDGLKVIIIEGTAMWVC